jgi:secondary thiamine-phosphate synthase enzyme
MLRQHQHRLSIVTRGRGLVEITTPVVQALHANRIDDGLVTLFIRHTSASLLIQENADADVRGDLERFFARLVTDAAA